MFEQGRFSSRTVDRQCVRWLWCGLWLACSLALGARAGLPDELILVPVRDARTHAMLRERTRSEEPAERIEAVTALGRIADPGDLPLIEALLADPDARVRAEAVNAVAAVETGRLGPHAAGLSADDAAAVRAALFAAGDGASWMVDVFETGLSDPDPGVRSAAARAAPLPAAEAGLRARIEDDPSASVVAAAWERLAGSGGEARDGCLAWALARPGTEHSVRALERVGAEDAVFHGHVADRLALRRGPELTAAIRAVGRARLAAAVPALLAGLDAYEAVPRQAACRVLSAFDAPGVVDALRDRLVHDRDLSVARAAAESLARHASPIATAALSAAAGSERARSRQWALDALGERRDAAGLPAVRSGVRDSEGDVREAALTALRRIDPAEVADLRDGVRAATRSPHSGEAAAALRLLGAAGDAHEVPYMLDRLTRIRPEHPWRVREAALDALMDLGLGQHVDRAIDLLARLVVPPPPGEPDWTHDYDEVRLAALRYIERFAGPEDGPRVLSAFDDPPPFPVRVALAGLLTRWTGVTHEAERGRVHRSYSVESLGPPGYQGNVGVPGIRPVSD